MVGADSDSGVRKGDAEAIPECGKEKSTEGLGSWAINFPGNRPISRHGSLRKCLYAFIFIPFLYSSNYVMI